MCSNSNILTLFYFVKIFFRFLSILVPLLLMYRLFKILFSTVISGESIAKNFSTIVKSVVCALVVFLLPSTISYFFTFINNYSDKEVVDCYLEANLNNIKSLKEKEEMETEERIKKRNEEAKKIAEENAKKRKEENNKKKKHPSTNNENSDTSSTNNEKSSNAKLTIIIGDSRMVGLCATLTGDWSGCQFSNGGSYKYGDSIFIAQGSMGYSWFESTAIPAVNNILNSNSNITYNIITNMGVNYLLYDVDKYISKYNELSSGVWGKHNFIIASVTPVDENMERKYGYSTKNSDIQLFNNQIKNGVSNVKYCDIYNGIINNFQTTDGLHYSGETYKNIYNKMLSCK